MRRSTNEVNVAERADVPPNRWLVRAYLWACELLYAELAGIYDSVSWLVSLGQWRSWQRGVWNEVRGDEIMELGCGTGAMLAEGMQRGMNILGVDSSPSMLVIAQRRLLECRLDAQLLLGDGRDLPLRDGHFDTLFATFPAGYILEATTLEEIGRVLCKNGRLVILGLWVELNITFLKNFVPIFYGRPSTVTQEYFVRRLSDAGFEAHWVEQRQGIFTVGVLVADRKHS